MVGLSPWGPTKGEGGVSWLHKDLCQVSPGSLPLPLRRDGKRVCCTGGSKVPLTQHIRTLWERVGYSVAPDTVGEQEDKEQVGDTVSIH